MKTLGLILLLSLVACVDTRVCNTPMERMACAQEDMAAAQRYQGLVGAYGVLQQQNQPYKPRY